MTRIEWAERTWNPVTGCTKVSDGCAHCYAERFARRFAGVHGHPYQVGFRPTLRPERLEHPLAWRRPAFTFVCSMSDLFHHAVPDSYLDQVFDVMERAERHVFMVLTKRSARMRAYVRRRRPGHQAPPPHIWLGVSAENHRVLWRVEDLRRTPAAVRFVSAEPLLGPLDTPLRPLCLDGIGWVIAGGESGPGARPADADWFRSLRDRCREFHAAFFFKQWGGLTPTAGGKLLDGVEHAERPPRPGSAA